MNVVIVESPAKAKTIEKYLGKDFKVFASFGHVRDLPSKNGSVRPDEDFAMTWEVDPKSQKHVNEIASAVKKADHLYLATDPDREGEAISWHIAEILKEKGLLPKIPTSRIAFNAITKNAVLEALKNPREIDQELVDAYLARLSLDYLVGFTLSPVLWRKLPGSRSAGRVQSVALRLVVEREQEIEAFDSQEYWTIEADFKTPSNRIFTARLTHLNDKKLDKFDLKSKEDAENAVQEILKHGYAVIKIEKKRTKRRAKPPFTTSTIQQEASRKLGFSPKKTMQVAQKLYEGVDIGGEVTGLITYMRTDSIQVEPAAIEEARQIIREDFGKEYVPETPTLYKSKAKNAQEAHEAIRPTELARRPQKLTSYLDRDQARLYELIWKRMMASQMAPAELDQMSVDIGNPSEKILFRANGSTIAFDGFLKLYRESVDEGQDDEEDQRLLPAMNEKDPLNRETTIPEQHFTQPPPRYSEASLVKKMEELGIGRPSTYARILQVLQERGYVKHENRQLSPEDRGRLVTTFLMNFFHKYVEYDFTADLEERLDNISAGDLQWKSVLHDFWGDFSSAIDATKPLTITDVLKVLEDHLSSYLFPQKEDGKNSRECTQCKTGTLGLRVGKFGAFIGCSNYPECKFTRPLDVGDQGERGGELTSDFEDKLLGTDPVLELPVYLKKGPYGFYAQWGESAPKGEKPKRASLPRGYAPQDFTLEQAISLGKLPREVGIHPETKEKVFAGLGRFGPYLKHGQEFISLKNDDVLDVGLNRAVTLIAEHALKPKRKSPLKVAKPKTAPKAKKVPAKAKKAPAKAKKEK
ncbi:DNA topoisomerase 1 [Candidatus Bealeia paramacronuclearis]|uniref:DNA topoisomerase 1 n=1 Tax=Candidatus Bealeia paramacronuclearis TaxID=1921001 RepID=A0ABZ2C2N9_9PROT|nr:DNA topoisomerase 1 [Candidatus Bealeia paramacronuclearis]